MVFDQYHTRILAQSDGTGSRETTAKIRVLADAGVKQMAVLAFTYTASNEQIDIGYVRVVKPDGSVVVTPDYNVQDMPAEISQQAPMYSDIHQKHVAVKGLGVGDTLEYDVTERTVRAEIPGQFWFEYSFEKNLIVLDEQLDLDVPADKSVTVVSSETQPVTTTNNGRKLYHWTSTNLSRPDPDAPEKSTKHWKPAVQATTFASWDQVGAWYRSLQAGPMTVTPAIQAKAAALTKGLNTEDEKIAALFNFVALHTHYVGLSFGIGRYQPHPADDVLSNEYGDCKDKHTLLATLLKAAGIEAWPVLISSTRELDPAVPSPAQFDHVITVVPTAGKLIWMDSTAEVAPVGVLVGTLRDKQALAIPPSKAPYLERTPADLPFAQVAQFQASGKLSDQGQFKGHIEQNYHGDVEMLMRVAFRQVPQSQWKEFVQRISGTMGFAGDVDNPNVSAVEDTATPFQLSYGYTRENYSDWESRRISPPMPPVGWESMPGVKQKKPGDDVEIGSPGKQTYSSTVELPAGWNLVSHSGVDLKEDWAEYHSEYSFANGVFRAERRLVFKKERVPLSDWDEYIAFREAIYRDTTADFPLLPPGSQQQAQNPNDPGQRIHEMLVQLQPLVEVAATLNADQPTGLPKAVETCRKTVQAFEEKSQTLAADSPESLYWAQMLGAGWTMLGWAELESKDLLTAEAYLRAAWQLTQNDLAGYQLARTLQAKGANTQAAHLYELASISDNSGGLSAYLTGNIDLHARIAEDYRKLTGKELSASALNHGQYNGSLRAELDKEIEIHQFVPKTSLNGDGYYAVSFQPDKPVKAILLQGGKNMASLIPALEGHRFPSTLPAGSKAQILREVRMICTQYAGCDAFMMLPSSVRIPAKPIIATPPPGVPKTVKLHQLPRLPQ